VIGVAILYIAINLSVIGVVPWRTFVPNTEHPEADFIVSIFMERIYGSTVATVFTGFVLWTAFGSVFALLLGYSRIPYAAAMDGTFFRVFGRVHSQKRFPHVSLLVIGILAIVASAIPLDIVIASLITTRILIQFVGQIAVLIRLRRAEPDRPRPFRMWLYPLPALVALAGWIFVFATSGAQVIGFGLATLGAGVGAFLLWRKRSPAVEAAV